MALEPVDLALAALTVLAAIALVSVFAVGVTGLRSPGELTILLAAIGVLGALLVEPYRRVQA